MGLFRYFSGLGMNYEKLHVVLRVSNTEEPMLSTVAGLTVKRYIKCLGVLVGSIEASDAYAPAIAKMRGRGREHWRRCCQGWW